MYNGINHLAFITKDLNKTIRFYRDLLGFPLIAGVGHGDYKHYFFKISPTDMIAFFAYPEAEPMVPKFAGTRSNLPLGFDHVSIGIDTKADLFALKDRLMAAGLKVSGPVDHGFIWSIYFDDPNNIPLEISWQYLEIENPPAIADDDPVEFALEGADPQPGHWPEVTNPTPEESWSAHPGNGYDILEAIQQSNRGKAVGE